MSLFPQQAKYCSFLGRNGGELLPPALKTPIPLCSAFIHLERKVLWDPGHPKAAAYSASSRGDILFGCLSQVPRGTKEWIRHM